MTIPPFNDRDEQSATIIVRFAFLHIFYRRAFLCAVSALFASLSFSFSFPQMGAVWCFSGVIFFAKALHSAIAFGDWEGKRKSRSTSQNMAEALKYFK